MATEMILFTMLILATVLGSVAIVVMGAVALVVFRSLAKEISELRLQQRNRQMDGIIAEVRGRANELVNLGQPPKVLDEFNDGELSQIMK